MTMVEKKQIMYVDGKEVEYTNEINILEVIRKAGVEVPTLCYNPELSIYGACRMCVVEVEGRGIQTSCTMPPEPGLKISVHTERTRRIRKMSLELLLAHHDRECTTCDKSGKCDLQELSNQYNVSKIRFEQLKEKAPIDDSNPSIIRDPNKCILCGACVRACNEFQGLGIIDFANRGSNTIVTPAFKKNMNDMDCTFCGQCATVCPTGALTIKSETDKVWDALYNKSKTVVAQIAPAVRVGVAEEFGLPVGENVIDLIVSALRKVGFNYVFDTNFTADLTIMEEGTEFLTRLKNNEKLPILTSCCPGWINYIEQKYPQFLDNLSTCKSPQGMFGAVIKEYFAKENNLDKKDITFVSFMPCTAKKYEAQREELAPDGVRDIDVVLTTQELVKLIKEAGIDFNTLEPSKPDQPFGEYTGAGVIFGASGGVAEAALRTAYEVATGKPLDNVNVTAVRGLQTFKEATIDVDGTEIKIAVVNTLAEAGKLLDKVEKGEATYHIIEIMACPGGCIGGGGQPYNWRRTNAKAKRAEGLYKSDEQLPLRKSHENPAIKTLYKNWLGEPNSHVAHKFLHTHYKNRKK